jgi:uncharacterized protein (DUF302 family)
VSMAEGLITIRSAHSVAATVDRLAEAATGAGLRIFARIDHGAGAAEVGMPLRPTELLIFGHPRGGTPLMLEAQTAGLDLPLRALAWEDDGGQVWLTAPEAHALAARHGLGDRSAAAVDAIAAGLDRLMHAAAGE